MLYGLPGLLRLANSTFAAPVSNPPHQCCCSPHLRAVDEIAARMEQQRARSGLFFNWDASAAQEEGGEAATVDMRTDGQTTQEAVS
jgi:hypothetical protein